MNFSRLAMVFIASFVFVAGGCAGIVRYVPERTLATCGEEDSADLSVLTYNTGLAPGIVRYASPRAPHVSNALAAEGADIMCIQEAWTEESAEHIRTSLGSPSARYFHVDTRGENESGDSCDPEDMRGIAACAVRECGGESDEDFTICALDRCRSHGIMLYLFHRSCLNCLVSSVGHDIQDIWRTCTREGGSSRVYEGGNGVILASRWPIKNRGILRLPSSGANRVALFATVEVPGKGDIEVACTHLSSEAPMSPTNRQFDSWDDEKRAQLVLISRRLRERSEGRPQLLIGDMNFGPEIGDAVSDTSGVVWTRALREGFTSPFADLSPTLCTTCSDNSLRSSNKNYLIDHVLVRQGNDGRVVTPVCAERRLEGSMLINPYGHEVRTNLSDHYGALVRLRIEAAPPP